MHNGRPLIWSSEFEERPQKDQISYLKKLCASQNDALDKMQQERNALADANALLKTNLENAQTAFDAQKKIVTDLITQDNEEKQGVAKRIQELETRVRAQDQTIRVLNGDLN